MFVHSPEWKVDLEGTFLGNTRGLGKSRLAAPALLPAPAVERLEFKLCRHIIILKTIIINRVTIRIADNSGYDK